jgi:serpin B
MTASAMRSLGIELFKRLHADENVLVSPYSLWSALAMLQPGARGAALAELTKVLGLDDVAAVTAMTTALAARAEPTPQQRSGIERGWLKGDFGFHLEIANALWIQAGYRIRADYAAAVTRAFAADPRPVDFAGAPVAACDAINRWASDKTHGRIRSIIDPNGMVAAMRGMLANAIYFKAAWADEFWPHNTKPKPFRLVGGGTKSVATMARVAWLLHADTPDFVAVQLPYVNPDVAMTILVPKAANIADADRALTSGRVDAVVAAMAGKEVALELPKFTFETSLQLGRQLAAVGLAQTLGAGADLSGISEEPGFAVGDVVHKTFVAVDEKGTEAAAVTAIAVAGAAPMAKPKPVEVKVDRPFYVLVRDLPTGALLFFGRVVEP